MRIDDHRQTCWCGHVYRDHATGGLQCLAVVDDPDRTSLQPCRCQHWEPTPDKRICKDCGQERPIGEFKNHGDHRGWTCRDCGRALDRKHKATYQQRHAERERARYRQIAATPKAKAREALRHAVQDGRVVRPAACESCGEKRPTAGHHDDYSRPLDVQWLCRSCHENVHRELRRV